MKWRRRRWRQRAAAIECSEWRGDSELDRAAGKATLKFAERTASGWSEPRVVSAGTDWFVNWADVPSVIRLGDGTLAAHWLQKSGPGTYAYDVRLAFSKDQGKTWSPPSRRIMTERRPNMASRHSFRCQARGWADLARWA